jgi:hypothetical protein
MGNNIRDTIAGPFVRASIWTSRQWRPVHDLALRVPTLVATEMGLRSSYGSPLLKEGFLFATFSNRTAGLKGDATAHRPLATLSSGGFRRRAALAIKKVLEQTPLDFDKFSVKRHSPLGGESAALLLHLKLRPGAENQPFLGTTYAKLERHRFQVAAIKARARNDTSEFL